MAALHHTVLRTDQAMWAYQELQHSFNTSSCHWECKEVLTGADYVPYSASKTVLGAGTCQRNASGT